MEQPLAEGVDRQDLQPARRLDGAREQPPRRRHALGEGANAVDLRDLPGEVAVIERHPPAENLEDPVRHVGGRSLGEGQRQDGRRIDAVEQQAHDPTRQHEGLARAGVLPTPTPRRAGRKRGIAASACRGGSSGRRSSVALPNAAVVVARRLPLLHARQMVVGSRLAHELDVGPRHEGAFRRR